MLLPIILGLLITAIPSQQKANDTSQSSVQQTQPGVVAADNSYGQENLSSLSINDSTLRMAPPVVGEKDEYPEFTRELLQVQWRSGDPIDLYVIKPHGVPHPPVVIYLYGYPSETDRFRDNEYCKRLVFKGYAAVGFVPALTGHRYHDRPMREWFVSQMPEALTESVHDVQMVERYLAGRGDLDLGRVGIFGTGSGGTIAILAASVDPELRAVDVMQPWGDWPTWLAKSSLVPESERAAYLKPQFLDSVAPLDPVRWLARVQTKSLRIQFVMDDLVTPPAAVQGMKAAAPHSAQVVEYETKHRQYEALGGGRAFDWIKQELRDANSQPQSARANDSEPKVSNERSR